MRVYSEHSEICVLEFFGTWSCLGRFEETENFYLLSCIGSFKLYMVLFFFITFKIESAKSNYKNKFLMVFRVDELNLDYKEVWIGIYQTFQISVADFSVILSNLDIRFRCDASRENTLQNILHHNVARRLSVSLWHNAANYVPS